MSFGVLLLFHHKQLYSLCEVSSRKSCSLGHRSDCRRRLQDGIPEHTAFDCKFLVDVFASGCGEQRGTACGKEISDLCMQFKFLYAMMCSPLFYAAAFLNLSNRFVGFLQHWIVIIPRTLPHNALAAVDLFLRLFIAHLHNAISRLPV